MAILTLKVTRAEGAAGSHSQNGSVARLLQMASQQIGSHTGNGHVNDPNAGYCSWQWNTPEDEAKP